MFKTISFYSHECCKKEELNLPLRFKGTDTFCEYGMPAVFLTRKSIKTALR